MKTVNELMEDVSWWTKEIRIRQTNLEEAVRTLQDRQSELVRAQQEAAREASQKKAA